MPMFWLLRIAFVALVSLVGLDRHGRGDPTLPDAVKKADAKYLDLKDTETEDKSKKIEAGGGEEDTEPTAQEISDGPLKAALTYTESKSEDSDETIACADRYRDLRRQRDRQVQGDLGLAIRRSACRSPISIRATLTPRSSSPSTPEARIAARIPRSSPAARTAQLADGRAWTVRWRPADCERSRR